ncbi:pleckstrin homology-like domain family B member 1 isoform X7 [Tachysurus ichikawai]
MNRSFPLYSLPPACTYVSAGFQDYDTVGQLNQIYGMPKVDSSPTSPAQLRHPTSTDPAFSCLPSPHGSSLSLCFEVCLSSSSSCFLLH